MWADRLRRVNGFSYVGFQRYLITISTRFRSRTFANASHAAALSSQISPFFAARHFEVVAYCLMPDHLHVLLEGTAENADLREAVRAWKQRTGYDWKRHSREPLWQPGYHDRVLREGEDTCLIVRYILWNPVRAGLVTTIREYPWIGSLRYSLAELEAHAGQWSPEWKHRSR
jgi:putative transposase